MESPKNKLLYLILPAFALVVCFSHLWSGTIAVDGIRYAHIAHNIVSSGDWINLWDAVDNRAYVNKPPLLLWLVALNIKTFGYSTFVAKASGVFFTFISIFLLFGLAKYLWDERIALWAVVLYVLTPNFFKNMLDLTFEGLIACGSLLCLWALARLCRQEGCPAWCGFWFGVGVLLLLQSKPPYAPMVCISSAIFFVLLWRRSVPFGLAGFIAGAILPVALGLAWFVLMREQYIAGALHNQVLTPLEREDGFVKRLIFWGISYFRNFLVAAVFGLVALWKDIRRIKTVEPERLLLWTFVLPLPLIMSLVQLRPRYIIIPMLAVTLLAAAEIARALPKISAVAMQALLLIATALCAVLFLGFKLEIHRTDGLVAFARSYPDILARPILYCIYTGEEKKSQAKTKMAVLLFNLEYGQKPKVFTPKAIVNLPKRKKFGLIADIGCAERIKELGFKYTIVREVPQAKQLFLWRG